MTAYQPAGSGSVEQVLGDISGLAEQIGSAGGVAALTREAGSRMFQPVTDVAALRQFLRDYQARILGPIELPAIQLAFHHAARSQVTELIELDQWIGREPLLEHFAAASRQIGKSQIKRLRPLRDQRVLQRYLAAVQNGAAHGWHTVVYGLILSIYSMPLRPGLVTFAEQTTRGFVHCAARRLGLTEAEGNDLVAGLCSELHTVVDQVLGQGSAPDQVFSIC